MTVNRRLFFGLLGGLPLGALATEKGEQAPVKAAAPPEPPIIRPVWSGDPLDIEDDLYLYMSMHMDVPRDEKNAMLRFYAGEQWPEEILRARRQHGRPCLVINYLPQIARKIAQNTLRPLTTEERHSLGSMVAYRNQDAQRLFNYIASAQAELAALPRYIFGAYEIR